MGLGGVGGGGERLLRPCYANQPKTLLFTEFTRPEARGHECSRHLPTCPKPCYLQQFCLFMQHVAGGCFMFSNTRRCHKCSCHFASMPKPLLFIAILPLCTTCVTLNASTGERVLSPKFESLELLKHESLHFHSHKHDVM